MAITLGIDCGTQSTKVLCYDSIKKEVISITTAPHDMISKEDGTREQEASWYIDALITCFNQIPSEIKQKVEAIGVSGQQHGFVPLDENGNPLYNVKLWCDTSTANYCDILTERLGGEEKVFSLIQNQILAGYTASKVLYLKENHPDLYSKLAHILLPHDYINYYLTGEYVMEDGDTSGTAFYNVEKREWSDEVLKAIDSERDLKETLPKILKTSEVVGTIREEVAKKLGINKDAIVSVGGGDNMMGAIGAGCTSDGDLVMSLGTSGTLFGYSEKLIADKKNRLAAFISSSGGYLPLLCTMNCTVATEQIRTLLDLGVKELDLIANESKAGANGIIFLPYFNGERTPNYPKAEAVIAGMNMTNTNRANIARASLESAIYSMKVGLEAFKEQGFKPAKIILIGGGAKSKIWAQIVSDMFNLDVMTPLITETAAFGGALQSLATLEKKSVKEITDIHTQFNKEKIFTPNKENYDLYKKGYEKYQKYDSSLSNLFK
ncbi:MAG: xylulokinase [Pleomorphochaeta sp.]